MALQKSMGAAEWAMLIVLSLLWGGSFFFNGILVKTLPPFTIVTDVFCLPLSRSI